MKNIIANRHKNIHQIDKNFLLGFEVEFIYDADKISEWNLQRTLKDIHRDICTGEDASIEEEGRFDDEGTLEIKTPPIPIKESLEVLHKVFQVVRKYGYTNKTCGLHASFSPVRDEVYSSLNPEKIVTSKLWDKLLKAFGRDDHYYCQSFKPNQKPYIESKAPQKLRKFYEEIYPKKGAAAYGYYDHYLVVNFENYKLRRTRYSRLEVRGMGNADYEKKFGKVVKYINQILTVFKRAYEVKFI